MPTVRTFDELEIWKQAQRLAKEIYFLADNNKKINKDFSFKDQLKRAVLSISNNIAEGFEYGNNKDFIKFLRYSKGSTGEVKNCLLFAVNVSFVHKDEIQDMIHTTTELGNRIGSLIKYLKNLNNSKPVTQNS